MNLTVFNAAVVLNPVPVSVTSIPGRPDDGLMPVTVSDEGCVTVNTGPVTSLPPIETFTGPVDAAGGTVTTSCLSVASVTVATMPLNETLLAVAIVLNPVPVMVTNVPTGPCVGDSEVISSGVISSSLSLQHTQDWFQAASDRIAQNEIKGLIFTRVRPCKNVGSVIKFWISSKNSVPH